MAQRGLCRPTRQRVCTGGVLPVFDDIQIEAAQLTAAKVVHSVVHVVELIVVVGGLYLALQGVGLLENPPIQWQQFIDGQRIRLGLKTGEISEQKTCRIADPTVSIGGPLEDFIGGGNLVAIVGSRHIEPQHICTQIVHRLTRGNDVTQRLGHLPSVAIDGEPMRQHAAIWRFAVGANSG